MSPTVIKDQLKHFVRSQWFRYLTIVLMTLLLFAPLLLIPQIFEQSDLCGGMCMRRFFLLFPGIGWDDLSRQIETAAIGVAILLTILTVTFLFGRLWCGYLCPMGGLPELVSKLFHDRWKIDYRSLPQVPIRYGYFITYLILLPALGFSACTLCNFITLPRLFEALSGDLRGIAYLISTIGAVNLGLLILLGFFAKLGRGYCQFLCPIGAIDGLVNRVAAKLPFVRRVRVERSRCTGCRVCAEVCICGAVRMVDRVAVVDQLSCMSCRECVVACEWGAIDWLPMPSEKMPKRLKKGIEVSPPPVWTAVTSEQNPKQTNNNRRRWVFIGLLSCIVLVWFNMDDAAAGERQSDPDGCLVCHAAEGLAYVNEKGVIRNASINSDHYFSSIHGNVPCRDCHRKIREYPHQAENGAVDCAASCHLEEPSQGVAYSHQTIAEEFADSIHGKGAVDGLTAENRWDESRNDQPPSCRRCHSNTLYIPLDKREEFKEIFAHEEEVCGNCHQGEVWNGQMGGHILRRLLGVRWTKQEEVAMCNECHLDQQAMTETQREDALSGEQKPSDAHFIYASDSYEMTLHGRLVSEDNAHGVSCNECHAPAGYHHGILPTEHPQSAVNPEQLTQLCGSSGCHAYADSPYNEDFLLSDMHDLDWVPGYFINTSPIETWQTSDWQKVLMFITPVSVIFIVTGIIWSIFAGSRSDALPILGGKRFEKVFLSRKKRPVKNSKKTDQVVKDRVFRQGVRRHWAEKFNRLRRKKEHPQGTSD
ncbi:MAG: 4Fe-4S binding protein [Candidatus Thiodiazotropha taylori]|nr:4Fe-4S binding protein [Candidatus Thiodiazotropha taylori]